MSKTKKHNVETPLKNDVETIQEKDELTQAKDESPAKQNDETLIETDEDGEEGDEDGEEDEDNVSSVDLNELIHMRLYDGLSFREIAKRKDVSLSMVARVLKGVDPQEPSKKTTVKNDAETGGEASRPTSPSTLIPETLSESVLPESIPENFVLRPALTPEEYQKYAKMKTADLISEVVQLKSQNASLQGVAQTRRGNGDHSSTYSENYIDALGKLVDKLAMQKEASKIVDRMFPEEKKDNEPSNELTRRLDRFEDRLERLNSPKDSTIDKAVEVVGKIVASVPRPQNTNELAIYRQGVADQLSTQHANTKSSESNMIDLKLKEMDLLDKLENRKIDHAEMVRQEGKESEKQIYSLIGEAIGADGIIGKLASGLGFIAKTKLEGGGQNRNAPQVIQVDCPACKTKFPTIEGTKTVICHSCGTVLGLQQPQQAQQPQPQPQQPTEPQTQQETTQQLTEQPQPTRETEKPISLKTRPGEYDF